MLASVFRTVIVYVAVITAMRLMGKRQLGELQPAELVTTFLISNVASICIDEPDLPLAASIVPIFLLTALEILNSTLAWFCPRYARLLFGKPITVIVRGEIRQQALQELRITASDLMEALRGKEYFSPAELLWATVEPNGSISTAPVPQNSEAPPMLPLLLEAVLPTAAASLLTTTLLPSPYTCEGGIEFLMIGVLLYFFRRERSMQLTAYVVSCLVLYLTPILLLNGSPVTLLFTYYQWMMVFAAIPLAMYNGERGNSPRWLFYWFYPAHVYLLWALGALLLG